MSHLVRLRIALADRPGSLAAVATVIAGQGGNIVSLDVHRAGAGAAVDDLVVEFPEPRHPGVIRDELARSGAATLLSHQAARELDLVVAVLQRVAGVLAAPGCDPLEDLARSVAELCSSPVAWVCPAPEAESFEAGRFAIERGGAVALRTTALPSNLSERLPGEVWLLAVPDPELPPGERVVFVARPLSSEFTATEIARVEATLALHHEIERVLAPADTKPSGEAEEAFNSDFPN